MLTVFILVLPVENVPGRRQETHIEVCLRACAARGAPGYSPEATVQGKVMLTFKDIKSLF